MTIQEPHYPLEQVLSVKKDRVDRAEKVFKEKKKALEIEEEKLKKVEKERDLVRKHHDEKLAQLRKALDEGTTSDEVLGMKAYLKVVKEKLAKEEAKVKEQQKQVKTAEQNLELAKQDLYRKRIEAEKIEIHKVAWNKEKQKEQMRLEAKEQDEVGTTIHQTRRKKRGDQ